MPARSWLIPLLGILLLLGSSPATAQRNVEARFGIQAQPTYILQIYPGFPESAQSGTIQASALFAQHNDWNTLSGKPLVGIDISVHHLGNNAVLGQLVAVRYRMAFDRKLGQRWRLTPSWALGFAYTNAPYDPISNRENIAISTTISFFAGAEMQLGYRLANRYELTAALGAHHSSSGHTRLPNVGLNSLYASIGAAYVLPAPTESIAESSAEPLNKKVGWGFRTGLGVQELGHTTAPTNGPSYHIYSLAAFAQRAVSRTSRARIGVEGYYNRAYRDYLIAQERDAAFRDVAVASGFAGIEYLYGHFGMYLQGHLNVYRPALRYWLLQTIGNSGFDKVKTRGGARFGVNWYFRNPYTTQGVTPFVGWYVKSNGFQADFTEATIGLTF